MLRRVPALLALLLALCGAAPQAVIEAPTTRKPGQSILLDGRKTVSDRPIRWRVLGPPIPLLTFDADGRKGVYAFLPDPEPGEYIFALVAVGSTGEDFDADVALHRVVVGEPAPEPPPPGPTPPPPGPGPVPPPGPVGETAHVTLVYEGDELRTARPEVRSALAKLESEGGLKINWHAYDDDQSAVKERNLMDFVQRAGGVPALILQAADGRVIAQYPCPPTPEGVLELINAGGVN